MATASPILPARPVTVEPRPAPGAPSRRDERLPNGTIAAYAAPILGVAVMWHMIGFPSAIYSRILLVVDLSLSSLGGSGLTHTSAALSASIRLAPSSRPVNETWPARSNFASALPL